jgi:hypothetical protein
MAEKPIPDFILNKGGNKPSGQGSAPPEKDTKEAPPSGKPIPGKPDEEEAPPSGPPGKPGPGRKPPAPDAKTPPPGKGGPQPEGKGAPPEGPPPGPMPGPSPELQRAQELLNEYVQGLIQGSGMDPNALQQTEQLLNAPETPDPTPGAMSNLVPKGTGGQRMGSIPSPGLPTGQMPPRVSPANPGVNLVGGLDRSLVEGMMMKTDTPEKENQQQPQSKGKPIPPGIKKK